ncbi:hypothetical protein C8R43DRAFT_1133977 [Mycena crocata]|nr:hypothetical protein C8R43DRAFT_1133977 [Mycena crocata]
MAPCTHQHKTARKREGNNSDSDGESTKKKLAVRKRREAAARYYRAHPQLREKNKLHAQQKKRSLFYLFNVLRLIIVQRAAVRLSKRKWDPPKKYKCTPTPLNEQSLRRLGSLKSTVILSAPSDPECVLPDCELPNPAHHSTSGLSVAQGTIYSRTSAERIAAAALAGMVVNTTPQDPEPEQEEDNTIMDSGPCVLVAHEAPWAVVAHSNRDEEEPSTRVKVAQTLVTTLNSGPLSGPTPAEAHEWDDVIIDVPPFLKTMRAKDWVKVQAWAENVGSFGLHTMPRFRASERECLAARKRLTVLRVSDRWGRSISSDD